MVVLQSCTDSLHILPGSSCEPFPTSSDGAYDICNVKVEEDIDIKEEEEDVKAEKGTGNEEEECLGIKQEEDIYSEEEEAEAVNTKEDNVDVKEEVS
jgi:hypothetical protein